MVFRALLYELTIDHTPPLMVGNEEINGKTSICPKERAWLLICNIFVCGVLFKRYSFFFLPRNLPNKVEKKMEEIPCFPLL